jgi:hypothetical protein
MNLWHRFSLRWNYIMRLQVLLDPNRHLVNSHIQN